MYWRDVMEAIRVQQNSTNRKWSHLSGFIYCRLFPLSLAQKHCSLGELGGFSILEPNCTLDFTFLVLCNLLLLFLSIYLRIWSYNTESQKIISISARFEPGSSELKTRSLTNWPAPRPKLATILFSFRTIMFMILFSQYLRDVKLPCPAYSKDRGLHLTRTDVFKLFPVSDLRYSYNYYTI